MLPKVEDRTALPNLGDECVLAHRGEPKPTLHLAAAADEPHPLALLQRAAAEQRKQRRLRLSGGAEQLEGGARALVAANVEQRVVGAGGRPNAPGRTQVARRGARGKCGRARLRERGAEAPPERVRERGGEWRELRRERWRWRRRVAEKGEAARSERADPARAASAALAARLSEQSTHAHRAEELACRGRLVASRVA